ncbi:hypothetical protein GCK32_019149, partial [Trichostrongylus colubriformis]
MNPIDWHSMASMAMSYACLGETNIATRYFAKSLARAPYDGMVRNALDKLAQLENDYVSCFKFAVFYGAIHQFGAPIWWSWFRVEES